MFGGEIVVALHEELYNWTVEDGAHPRLLVFADGRILHKVWNGERSHWFVTRIPASEVEALRREVAESLAGVPQHFSCYGASHQVTTSLLVKDADVWRLRQVRALWACMENPGRNKKSSRRPPEDPTDVLPPEFESVYERLTAFDAEGGTVWHVPELALQLSRIPQAHVPATPWPAAIPKPPMPVEEGEYVLPGEYDEVVRTLLPRSGGWTIGEDTWRVTVSRTMPGDDEFGVAMTQARKRLAGTSEAQCRDVMSEIRLCLDDHPALDSRADTLCREFVLHAETAESCTWEETNDDVCLHAYHNGCPR